VCLVYDPRELTGVTTARSEVAGILQMVLELTLTVSRVCTSQLRRILWRMGQGRRYERMTRGSSRRARYDTYAANWTYDTRMSVLNVQT
jgi:hypothetical protein